MRYRESGNVHKDFHLATDSTIEFVLENYGPDFLRELFSRTAQRVYRDIYTQLKDGDAGALVEHLRYFMDREGGRYRITQENDEVVFEVESCPAVRHLTERGIRPKTDFCLQTALQNAAWSESTPFEITTLVTGTGTCRQVVRRRHATE